MRGQTDHTRDGAARALAKTQHGAIAREQLRRLGFSDKAVDYRIAKGWLTPVFRGVFALGRAELGPRGWWMAAVLSVDEDRAAISHDSAVAFYEVGRSRLLRPVHVSVPAAGRRHERSGIVVHRRRAPFDVVVRNGIRVTSPECTIVDMAATCSQEEVEAMLNEAVIRRITTVEKVRSAVDAAGRRPGAKQLRRVIDVRTYRFTRSGLERAFLRIARKAGLPRPLTNQLVHGYEVDFYWPELGLVVETDGLAYHRTPAQQARDLERDQALMGAGLTCCRFGHGQIRYEPKRGERVLRTLAAQRR